MNQNPVKLGPLTLLLTVISICLTALAILTLTTARADRSLSEKYADTVTTRYALEKQGQAYLKEVSQAVSQNRVQELPETETDQEGVIWKTFEEGDNKLTVGILPKEDGYRIVSWRQEKEWTQDIDIGNLW